ncbi:SPASM domain-containing protein [Flammeovirga yaeyamensis]|uniref:SPASM domain-containing protein n=2 Tax=Flammeovirga yaeyamensis TaxID=367791 RepID=A0AAX1N7S8_9BACT|nr:radical SAM/SPASM domain-containing protein [Flammeovirga yaeyamensis]NMF36416.1 radical SAM protein [Flammeovirga yaeyamensis]QWG03624.1 SPASM domain-containing protein [Flammeovirga yaeyamensis]
MQKLSLKKLYNAGLIFLSYQMSKQLGKPIHWGNPISIAIEPTTSCNLRCPECPSGLRSFTRPTGMLSEDLFTKVIDELKDTLMNLTFYFQGEPYLNKNFLNMVKIASERKVFTSTSTNAHYLNEEMSVKTVASGLDRLIVSLDGTTQETYENYRIGGDINKVILGIKNVVDAKKQLNSSTPKIVIQFLVVRPNEHQIEEAKQLAKELEVDDIQFKTAQIYDYENGSPLIPSLDQYSRYQKTKEGKYKFKGKWERHCWRLWNSAVITWDGKVVPCCFDKDAKYVLGTIKNDYIGFRKIWRSQSYINFRKQILKGRENIDICKNCTEGLTIYN